MQICLWQNSSTGSAKEFFVGKHFEKQLLVRVKEEWNNNIKMDRLWECKLKRTGSSLGPMAGFGFCGGVFSRNIISAFVYKISQPVS